jgi:hypothetical protein
MRYFRRSDAAPIAAGITAGLLYLLFKDTMNRIQYVESLRLYWITKNNGEKGMPFIYKSFMRQTHAPYWWGDGLQFRLGRYTFQIGILKGKNEDLLSALEGEELDITPQEIREWGRPSQDEPPA